ncbi:MAG: dihydrofolate reductase family protein [Actinomycetota bacterium]|nr:dihydrofolate reductase family protein [Actinomycetota bacterium]MDQ2957709.1 dihydrofolate reductase family protein [Actinomycetota bacterium]
MSKLLYSVSMSLDGFIAGPGGDMSWLTPHLGPNPELDALQRDIGALLVGHRTFQGDDPNRGTDKEGAFGGTWSGPIVVVTHHPPAEPVPGITFSDSLLGGLATARAAAGDRYVNILGADIARQCLAAGELDEILTIIVPVFLGDGVRLFEHPGGRHVQLERLSLVEGPRATNLWMRVVR